jgi:formylmethanofuran dehydrogenase subunit D
MLDKQVLKNQQGTPMGIFIPMQSWNNLIFQYPDIETLGADLPQWEKDFIDKRLDMAQRYPEHLKPIETLFEIL